MAVTFDRTAIQAALAMSNPAVSSYLDLETGAVIVINEGDSSAANEALSSQVMEGYGDRYRYISGGNANADDAAVSLWLEGEGL